MGDDNNWKEESLSSMENSLGDRQNAESFPSLHIAFKNKFKKATKDNVRLRMALWWPLSLRWCFKLLLRSMKKGEKLPES